MEYVRPKVELYRTRTFSEKISDTFAFVRESWRPILKYAVYLLLPVSVVMAFFMNNFMDSYLRMFAGVAAGGFADGDTSQLMTFGLTTLGLLLTAMVGSMLVTALTYALIRLYEQRGEQRLMELAGTELKPMLMLMLGRTVRLMLAWLAFMLLVGILVALLLVLTAMISPLLMLAALFVVYAVLLVVVVPLSLTMPVYMLEDGIGIIEAFQKAWRLGFATWGGVLAVVLVLAIIGSVVESFVGLPWTIMLLVKSIFTLQGETAGFYDSVVYSFLQYLLCIVQCFASLIVSVLTLVGITIQYGHASDKIDGVGVAMNIGKFDELDEV